MLASQAISRDLRCGDNDLLSCISNFHAPPSFPDRRVEQADYLPLGQGPWLRTMTVFLAAGGSATVSQPSRLNERQIAFFHKNWERNGATCISSMTFRSYPRRAPATFRQSARQGVSKRAILHRSALPLPIQRSNTRRGLCRIGLFNRRSVTTRYSNCERHPAPR